MSTEALGPRSREELLRSLEGEYDVIVIGGGIVGCGTSLEAARHGHRVLLLEKGDIGGGTSSRSSRLIHGGLRYLKYGRLRMVFDGSRERHWLRSTYPHLVRPIRFIIPFYQGVGEGPLITRLGLWLYDLMAGFSNVRIHDSMRREQVLAAEPNLRKEGLLGGASYYDCITDDFRLVLLNAKLAAAAGVHILTYAMVESLLVSHGQVEGVRFKDLLGGRSREVRGRVIINATGPWGDTVRGMLPSSERKLRPTKGAHIFVPRSRVGNNNAVVMRSPADERVVFAMPWRHLALVGTTDTDFEGDLDEVEADASDVEYLLEAVNFTFPKAHLSLEDVVSSFASLRPLIGVYGVPESEVTRDFKIVQDTQGLLSILGGKLTTYRRAAKKTVRMVNKLLPRGRMTSGRSAIPAGGVPKSEFEDLTDAIGEELASLGLQGDVAEHLMASYGGDCARLLDYYKDKGLRRRLVPDLPYTFGETIYAVEHEMALRLEDVLVRRTSVMYEDARHGLEVAEEVARLMGSRLGWDDNQISEELEAYSRSVSSAVAFRGEK